MSDRRYGLLTSKTAARRFRCFKTAAEAHIALKFFQAVAGDEKAGAWCRAEGFSVQKGEVTNLNTAGGFVVPSELSAAIINLRDTVGIARQTCNVVEMNSDTLNIPRRSSGLSAWAMCACANTCRTGHCGIVASLRRRTQAKRWPSSFPIPKAKARERSRFAYLSRAVPRRRLRWLPLRPSPPWAAGKDYDPARDQLVTFTFDHIFSPTIVNEARLGYNRSKLYKVSQGADGPNYAVSVFNLANTSTNPFDFGVPNAAISGFTTPGSPSQSIANLD